MKKRWEMTDYERLKAWRENKHPTCWEECPLRSVLRDEDGAALCDILPYNTIKIRVGDPCPAWRMWIAFGLDEKETT